MAGGTGYFTHQFAWADKLAVTGLDRNLDWLAFAERHVIGTESYLHGSALALPFADNSFDRVVSITALCFVADQTVWNLRLGCAIFAPEVNGWRGTWKMHCLPVCRRSGCDPSKHLSHNSASPEFSGGMYRSRYSRA